MAIVAALFALPSIAIAPASAPRLNQYYVQAVTIKVDRAARMLSGKVVADSFDTHFCTSSNDWPINVRRAMPGPDKKVVHTRTNFSAEWKFKVRSADPEGKARLRRGPELSQSTPTATATAPARAPSGRRSARSIS